LILGDLPKISVRLLCFIALISSAFSSISQGYIDLLSVEYFEGLNKGNYDRFSVINTTLQAPIPLPSKDVILAGAVLEGTDIRSENIEYSARNVTFNIGFQKQLAAGKSILALAFNRFNSDGYTLAGDFYQFGFVSLYTYKTTEKATFQIGFYTNREFLGVVATPLFGIDWKISDRVRFSGVLPASANLAYKHTKKWYSGLHFLGIFQTYKQPALGDFYVQRSVNQLSFYTEYYLAKYIVANFKLGYRVGSAYRLFREEDKIDWALNVIKFGDNREEISFISSDQFVVSASLKFRFPLEN